MSIQAIDRSSVHRLTSGQVVIDLQTAVKELVENALDAGATSIDVKFKEHGIDSIEVSDNGKGIDRENWPGIALKHHTSKLSSFEDLTSVSTLGFRGEALSSLCGTATLSLVTSTASTAPVGTSLTFTRSGECVVGGKAARSKGTTIQVDKLFESVPVRRKDLIKNTKREFAKALELLQAYALVSTGVRFEVKNTTKSKTMTHLQSPASPSLRSNFSSIFAPKSLQTMMELALDLEVAADKSVLRWTEGSAGDTKVHVKGLVSKPSAGNGRTSGNRQFYYINGRPFHPTKIAKAVNEVYKSFVPGSFPTIVADFRLATDAYDVNVSPDKRTIFLHSEGNLIAALKTALEEFYRPSQATFEMTQIGSKPTAATKNAAKEADETESDTAEIQEEQEDGGDRPNKRRRKERESAAPAGDEEQKPARDVLEGSMSPAHGGVDESMDVEVDAGLFASTQDYHLPPEFEISLDNNDSSFELPIPPSPIRRSLEASSEAGPSSPSRVDTILGPSRFQPSPGRDEIEFDPIPSTSQTSPIAPPSPSTCGTKSPKSQPLFRSSLSPSPVPARAPSRSPPGPSSVIVSARLRQPQLTFGSTAAEPNKSDVGAKRDRKGKAKADDQNGLRSMRNLLQNFVKPGTTGPFPVRDDDDDNADEAMSATDGDSEVDELNASEEGIGDDAEAGEDPGGTLEQDVEADASKPGAKEAERDNSESGAGDEVEIVEDSFVTASPHQEPEMEEDDDEIEVVSASCACVHGSPDDAALERNPRAAPVRSANAPVVEAVAPFGAAPAEVAGIFVAADTTLDLDLDSLETVWSNKATTALSQSRHCEGSPALSNTEEHEEMAGAGVEEADDAAEATLSRVVSKDDFESMEVVGQFNLGFIIARRRVRTVSKAVAQSDDLHDDLFIIDQHASDEKYNFEKLQAETVIQSQRLLAPRVLNLPSHDEITAIEHLDLLRLNGYDVVVDEDADVGERVKLLAQPVSNKTVFDIADFEELLDLISTRAGNEVVRPSKTRKMFASRACRKSVMIGKALNSKQMTMIVRHMGGMDQPWACPHGRPTMRWLAGLGSKPDADGRSTLRPILEAYDRQG
ncbi:hypothetical protein JCM11491_003013 [Sporobolomyces phaffii]